MLLTSPHNPTLKAIRKAVAAGSRTAEGWGVVESPKLVAEAIRSGLAIRGVFVDESVSEAPAGAPVVRVATKAFREIQSTEHSQGVIALVEPPQRDAARGGLLLALDRIQDPGNAGAMIRAAEAFGAAGVVLLEGCVDAWNPKCVRASAGSLFRVPVIERARSLEAFTDRAWYAAMGGASQLAVNEVDWTKPALLLVGNEGSGVDAKWLSRAAPVRIPVSNVESLNAAVAAAIFLYEAQRQRASHPTP